MAKYSPLSYVTRLLPFWVNSQLDINSSNPPRLCLNEVASAALKDHAQYENEQSQYIPPAPGPAAATSLVATEVNSSRESTPRNDHGEKRGHIEFSLGDALRSSKKNRRSHFCLKLLFDTGIQVGRKKIRKQQVLINVEIVNDIINCLKHVSDYFDTLQDGPESLRAAVKFAANITQHRCEEIVAEVLASSDLTQGSTLSSTQRKGKCMCIAEEEHFYD